MATRRTITVTIQKIAANLAALRGYLQSHYEAQPLVNKLVAMWAAKYFPGLMTYGQMTTLVDEVNRLQHEDGGWSLTELGTWKRRDNTPLETRSDGYATGLVVLVFEESLDHREQETAHCARPCVA